MTMRRVWVQIHLWLGLTLGVLGVAIGVTGSVLVYEHFSEAGTPHRGHASNAAFRELPARPEMPA